MTYIDIKAATKSVVEEKMAQGMSKQDAEQALLDAGFAMLNAQKIGFIDLKLMYQIMDRRFSGQLARDMEEAKRQYREVHGLNELLDDYKKEGLKKEESEKTLIKVLYDSFIEDKVGEPELLDGLLWSMGYRLKEEFYLDFYAGKNPKLAYEKDE